MHNPGFMSEGVTDLNGPVSPTKKAKCPIFEKLATAHIIL